jgi:toxin ParE1/3/4
VRIRWTLVAISDRDAIFDYVGSRDLRAAEGLDGRIEDRIEGLVDFPRSGRIGRLAGTRELVLTDTPYIAVYEVSDRDILILRILHGARIWPDRRLTVLIGGRSTHSHSNT